MSILPAALRFIRRDPATTAPPIAAPWEPGSPEMAEAQVAVAEFHAATEVLRGADPADEPRWDDAIERHGWAVEDLCAAIRRAARPRPAAGELDHRGLPYWAPWVVVGGLLFADTDDCGLVVLDLS